MKFASHPPPTEPMAAPQARIVIRPQQRILVRKIMGIVLLVVLFAVLPTVLSQLTRADASPRDYLPGFALLCGMMGLYLVFITRALFVALARGAEICVCGDHLDIRLDGDTRHLVWSDIRQLRFGDIHFRIITGKEELSIPFLSPDDQKLLYRLHYRHTGLTPDEGRFLAGPSPPPPL
ncbi:MAG: hypothetical protein HN904_10160 [Victivallales bacterium]|nr:hypothetical protein [Victivallales bacterium]